MAGPPDLTRADWLFEYPPARSLLLDQEALRIYEHAYYLGIEVEKESDPPISFSTLMAALLSGKDDTSRWFARIASEYGPKKDAVFAEKHATEEIVTKSSEKSGKPDYVRLSNDKNLLTSSARAVIGNAENWAHRVGGSDIGARHLVAAYVLNPPAAHRDQMQNRWGFQETKWRSEFFAWVAPRYTAEQWADSSRRVAPTKTVPSFEQQKIKGKDLAYPGDEGTVAILDNAARFHARRNDQWLRLQTVFYALVETARNDTAVRECVMPVYAAVSAAESEYRDAQETYFLKPSPEEWEPFSALDISPRVLNALETARELAVATRHDTDNEFHVGAMHLAGAVISRRVDGDEELLSIGIKPQPLRLALIEHAKQGAESGELWREALGEEESLQSGRPVDLNSDEPEAVVRLDQNWESDPLSIRRDVESFAALLASKSLEPPLSIGLFGPWGSGKTTFLKRLRRSVEKRAEEAGSPKSKNTPYLSNIVHVDFNAWHFAEEALTSSLVDTVFRALSDYIGDKKVIAGLEWKEQKRKALESTKRKVAAADAVREAAQTAVQEAETKLTTELQKAEAETASLQSVAKAVWTAAKKSLQESRVVKDSGILESLGDAVNSADELEARLGAVRARPARMLSDLGFGRTLLFVGLVLVLPPAVAWLVGKALNLGQIGQIISSTSAILSVIALWASAASKAVSKVDQAITTVSNEYATRVASDPDVVFAKQNLEKAKASAATAAASLQVAREELARAQAEVVNASLPAQMFQLVSGRIEDQSYAKELTSLSLARADLEALSRILSDQRNEAETTNENSPGSDNPPSPAKRAVDRVILYIDDLDRCKPADVVRVLQLVHMLLAFELFVVVVAVDARWVEQSLIESYRWLAPSDSEPPDNQGALSSEEDAIPHRRSPRVTPQDYLEKIFQISFWLEPMTSARAASYLASLVRAPAREIGAVQAPGISVNETGQDVAPPVIGKIEIAGIELDYMRALAAYVGPSPRRVKRLVNAYRLIKARMTDAQLSTFLTDRATEDGGLRSGPYQIVIALLVIGTGAPASSAFILKELAEWDPRDGLETIVEEFRGRNHPDWTMAAQVIEMVMQTQKAKDVSELRGWARKVGRFLLNSPSMEVRYGTSQSFTAPQQHSSGSEEQQQQTEENVE
jgi:tRNA A37 threonylcarbamoyladenosine biosynthesis protein TsaE